MIIRQLCRFPTAGKEDPVGDYGEGVKRVFEDYKKAGMEDVEIKLYAEDRHELVNEVDRDVVFADVLAWIEKHI